MRNDRSGSGFTACDGPHPHAVKRPNELSPLADWATALTWHFVCITRPRIRVLRICDTGNHMELKGRRVHFAIKDIYFPAPGAVLGEMHGEDLMSGQVVDVSDSGLDPDAFVVVKVDNLDDPVVVSVERIRDWQ